ncbi:MAG: DUF447 domain-containing protein [Candidatus Heimdallarchaeota archaeon]
MFPWNPQNWLVVSEKTIYEVIVTTQDDQNTNFAPMGVQFEGEGVIIRPFLDTRTYHLLEKNRECVVNICGDIRPFVVGALKCGVEGYQPSFANSAKVQAKRLSSSVAWLECSVQSIETSNSSSRDSFTLKILHHGTTGQAICLSRADTAILEAIIHASRLHLCKTLNEEKDLKNRITSYLRLAGRISSAQHHRAAIAAITRKTGLREGEIAASRG